MPPSQRSQCSSEVTKLFKKIVFLAIGFTFAFSFFRQTELPSRNANKDAGTSSNTISEKGNGNVKLKTILYWNSFFGIKDYTFGMGEEPLKKAQCPVSRCFMTDDRQLFNQSDVIVFSIQRLNVSDLPTHRFPHQRFVFYEMESPVNTDMRAVLVSNRTRYGFFNWTMTYRLDSDIVNRNSYGVTVPRRSLASVYPVPSTDDSGDPSNMSVSIGQKTKLVAWFVSNCQTQSRREEYVRRLAQFVPVDIYGRCGNRSCTDRFQCWEMLGRHYKFYVAFENSLCPDYVTEKLTKPLMKGVVPVVYGGVDYSKFAPPHSFIDVGDFDSPQLLADYLLLLNRTDRLYARYFDWKRDYSVETVSHHGWCHLCKLANDPVIPAKIYTDIHKWWVQGRACALKPIFG